MSNKRECSECKRTVVFHFSCDRENCINCKKDAPLEQVTPLEVVPVKETPEQAKIKHLRKLKSEAMARYRKKYPEKCHQKAREMSKNQYDRRKSDPEFLRKKCESSKKSYRKRKALQAESQESLESKRSQESLESQ